MRHVQVTHAGRVWSSRPALPLLGLIVLLVATSVSAALGQTNGVVNTVPSAEQDSQIKAKLASAQEDFNRALATQSNHPRGATAAEFIEYRSALQQLVRSYQLQLDEFAALERTRTRVRELERTTHLWTGFTEPPPYSVLMVDELRNSTQSCLAKIKTVEVTLKVDEKLLTDSQMALKERAKKIRRIDEQIETAVAPETAARLTWLRELESARYRDEAASVAVHAIRIKLDHQELSENRQRLAFLQRQLLLASQHVSFPQVDFDKVISGLDAERRLLESDIQATDHELAACEQSLASSRESLGLLLQQASAASTNTAAVRNLRDSEELQSLQAEIAAERLTLLREMLCQRQLFFTVNSNCRQRHGSS